ncbi:MAG: DUF692 domain-containing protein [Lactobacillaceae bacterium]|jgi:uncharacterized protein (UPF0276 family)|nr:DUF692 domain-containing protein [Lactobacillaceae bacterium]
MKFGFSYRPIIHKTELSKILDIVDYVEIMPDIMTIDDLLELKNAIGEKEVGIYSLKTSLASPEGIQQQNDRFYFLAGQYFNTKYYSDHVGVSYIDNKYLTTVMPTVFCKRNIDVVSMNLDGILTHYPSKKYLIENIVNPSHHPESIMSEGEFFTNIVQNNSKIGVMLDITNAYVSAINMGIDPIKYIKDFPLEYVQTIHVAGFEYINNKIQDTHAVSINIIILELLKFVLDKTTPEFVMLERDFNHDGTNLINELKMIKNFFYL